MEHAKLVVVRMEEARELRGMSVAELARRASIDRKRLWYILDGQRQMRADEFVRLCVVLNLGMGTSSRPIWRKSYRAVDAERLGIERRGRMPPA